MDKVEPIERPVDTTDAEADFFSEEVLRESEPSPEPIAEVRARVRMRLHALVSQFDQVQGRTEEVIGLWREVTSQEYAEVLDLPAHASIEEMIEAMRDLRFKRHDISYLLAPLGKVWKRRAKKN